MDYVQMISFLFIRGSLFLKWSARWNKTCIVLFPSGTELNTYVWWCLNSHNEPMVLLPHLIDKNTAVKGVCLTCPGQITQAWDLSRNYSHSLKPRTSTRTSEMYSLTLLLCQLCDSGFPPHLGGDLTPTLSLCPWRTGCHRHCEMTLTTSCWQRKPWWLFPVGVTLSCALLFLTLLGVSELNLSLLFSWYLPHLLLLANLTSYAYLGLPIYLLKRPDLI